MKKEIISSVICIIILFSVAYYHFELRCAPICMEGYCGYCDYVSTGVVCNDSYYTVGMLYEFGFCECIQPSFCCIWKYKKLKGD